MNYRSLMMQQQGFSLIEGLVSILLVALIGLGIGFNLAKQLKMHGSISAQSTTVNEIRAQLENTGVTDSCSKNGTTSNVDIKIGSTTTTATRACTYSLATLTVTDAAGGEVSESVVTASVSYTDDDSKLSKASLVFSN